MSEILGALGLEARTVRRVLVPEPVTTRGEEEATRALMLDTLAQLREVDPQPPPPARKKRLRINVTLAWE